MPTFPQRLNRPIVAILAVAAIAGGLRFYHLSYPRERVFDEVYYSKDACNYLGEPAKACGLTSSGEKYWRRTRGEVSWVHPPLGKWAIAVGEKIYGITPFGWRFSSAVFGTLSVVALALIAQVLFGSPLWTFVAGLLLATESLNFVQSRVSMLDIFVAFWVVLGFLFVVLDRRWIDRRTVYPREEPEVPDQSPPQPVEQPAPTAPSPIWRPWRYAAGLAFGAGFASKWSAATAIFGAAVLSYAWEATRRRRVGRRPASTEEPGRGETPAPGRGLRFVSYLLIFFTGPFLLLVAAAIARFAGFSTLIPELILVVATLLGIVAALVVARKEDLGGWDLWAIAIPVVGIYFAFRAIWRASARPERHPFLQTTIQESFGIVVAFLVLPAAAYVASYTPWFVDHGVHLSGCVHITERSYPDTTNDWCNLQNAMRNYHQHLKTTELDAKTHRFTPIHPYLSPAWKWIVLLRPVLYFARYPTDAYRRVIYANGNPAIFWGSLFAVPYLLMLWRRRKDWRAGFGVVATLGQYLPWFVVSRPMFFFYMTPVTPFLVLACTFTAKDLSELHVAGSRSRPYLPVAAGFVALSVGLFLFFFPVLTGAPISTLWFRAHTWMKGWV